MTTIYDVIRRPLVTEKSNYQSNKLRQYSFEVTSAATRTLVKDAIETLFDVKVESVNIINTPAKRGRRARSRRLMVRRAGYKKAIVTLQAGQTLQIFEGVQ
jgi:large subunit ribosomal protein L23